MMCSSQCKCGSQSKPCRNKVICCEIFAAHDFVYRDFVGSEASVTFEKCLLHYSGYVYTFSSSKLQALL